ncbi:MAG: hypothetical protein M5R36_09360 [Deltaproteobacteria bacterium]|nr:hypothetical protein [Deltaproteobacteria bacterium]
MRRAPSRFGWPVRILLALTLTTGVLFFVTRILEKLEDEQVIDTAVPDDRVAHVTGEIFEQRLIDGTRFFVTVDPSMIASMFPVEKPEGTYRVFVTGGSFAMGTPYVHQDRLLPGYGGISSWLLAELETRFPGGKFEVVNFGVGAQNSSRVRGVVQQLVTAKPDLIVVLTGNNEGYLPATPWNEELNRWVLYRALKKTVVPKTALKDRPYFTPQDPDTKAIEENFQNNIRAIAKTAREAGVALGLGTLPINYRYIGPDPRGAAESPGDDAFQRGLQAMELRRYEQAIEEFSKSKDQPRAAARIGACFEKLGDPEQARRFYRVAVQLLPLNRTRPSYNDFVRTFSAGEAVALFDLEKRAETLGDAGLPPPWFFYDYCHLTWRGYADAAAEIARVLEKNPLLTGRFGPPLPPRTAEQLIERYHWQDLYVTDLKFNDRVLSGRPWK